MKAKDILKAMVKSGMANVSIYTGKVIKESNSEVISGKIVNKKEYIYSFDEIVYVNPSIVILTTHGEKAFLYEI